MAGTDMRRLGEDPDFASMYAELRNFGRALLARDACLTLSPTALVNEGLLRLINASDFSAESIEHLKQAAMNAMRNALTDEARRRAAAKRGSGVRPDSLEVVERLDSLARNVEAELDLHRAVEKLAQIDLRKARVFRDRHYFDHDLAEIAATLGVAERTVTRDLKLAKAWLARELGGTVAGES